MAKKLRKIPPSTDDLAAFIMGGRALYHQACRSQVLYHRDSGLLSNAIKAPYIQCTGVVCQGLWDWYWLSSCTAESLEKEFYILEEYEADPVFALRYNSEVGYMYLEKLPDDDEPITQPIHLPLI